MTNCNLLCLYCQNYDISHLGDGAIKTEEQVAQYMLRLQIMGCHNMNLVIPTHFTPQLVKAIAIDAREVLRLPIVWNCGGYENVETIKLLDCIVDIYMPDIKYSGSGLARRYSNALRREHDSFGNLTNNVRASYICLVLRLILICLKPRRDNEHE